MNWESINICKIKTETKPINKRLLDLKIKFFIKKKFQTKDSKILLKNNKYGSWVIK